MAEKPAKKRGKKKGAPKTGGRAKGTPNRSSLYIRAELADAGVNLVERFLAEVALLEKPADRVAELRWLFQFVSPRLKDIDGFCDVDPPSSPTPAAPAAAAPAIEQAPADLSRQERLALIRGSLPGKPEASG